MNNENIKLNFVCSTNDITSQMPISQLKSEYHIPPMLSSDQLYFKVFLILNDRFETGFHKVDFSDMKRKAAYRKINKMLGGY